MISRIRFEARIECYRRKIWILFSSVLFNLPPLGGRSWLSPFALIRVSRTFLTMANIPWLLLWLMDDVLLAFFFAFAGLEHYLKSVATFWFTMRRCCLALVLLPFISTFGQLIGYACLELGCYLSLFFTSQILFFIFFTSRLSRGVSLYFFFDISSLSIVHLCSSWLAWL